MKNKLFLLSYETDLCFVFAPTKRKAQELRYGDVDRRTRVFEFTLIPNEEQLRGVIKAHLEYHKRTGWNIEIDPPDLDTFVEQVLTAIKENNT